MIKKLYLNQLFVVEPGRVRHEGDVLGPHVEQWVPMLQGPIESQLKFNDLEIRGVGRRRLARRFGLGVIELQRWIGQLVAHHEYCHLRQCVSYRFDGQGKVVLKRLELSQHHCDHPRESEKKTTTTTLN